MNPQTVRIDWGRVVLAGVLPVILSLVAVFVIIFVYAASLAIQARGQPDQAQISHFANQVAPWGSRILMIPLTALGARWVARKVGSSGRLHGFLVGVVAALIVVMVSIYASVRPDLVVIAGSSVLTVAAGWLGGVWGAPAGRAVQPS